MSRRNSLIVAVVLVATALAATVPPTSAATISAPDLSRNSCSTIEEATPSYGVLDGLSIAFQGTTAGTGLQVLAETGGSSNGALLYLNADTGSVVYWPQTGAAGLPLLTGSIPGYTVGDEISVVLHVEPAAGSFANATLYGLVGDLSMIDTSVAPLDSDGHDYFDGVISGPDDGAFCVMVESWGDSIDDPPPLDSFGGTLALGSIGNGESLTIPAPPATTTTTAPPTTTTTTTVASSASAVWDDGQNVATSLSRLLVAVSVPALIGVAIAGVFRSAAVSG